VSANSPEEHTAKPIDVSRRQALKRGAIAGAAIAWAVPTVQAISVSAAHADSPSVAVKGHQQHRQPGGQPDVQVLGTQAQSGSLPKTGSSVPVVPVAAVGTAAVAAGAAALAASRIRKDSDTAE
jgi:LPXTG-motif cell wall-anchored protein